jgi:uncharacterized membrane protein
MKMKIALKKNWDLSYFALFYMILWMLLGMVGLVLSTPRYSHWTLQFSIYMFMFAVVSGLITLFYYGIKNMFDIEITKD